ncbi:MAG: hypothetical protein K8R02_01945 [Anaerohalosphaeraceae bacterium]|nr:hypothetical protein [Anaerohalosphaeraceae bacterium]
MKDFFFILIGAICSTLGGCVAIWYQAKKTRQIRFEEVRGEQELEAYKKALSLTDRLWNMLVAEQNTTEDALVFLCENNKWLSINQILLPHKFVENWSSIGLNLRSIKRQDETRPRTSENADPGKVTEAIRPIREEEKFIKKLVQEMDEVLRDKLKMELVKIKVYDDKKEL